ncbi:MAG: SRPBCC domain-containing protein [Rhodospirillales bacterium]|nr:SRPBCC domain-containing protein [Rhodospirillales bacterium]
MKYRHEFRVRASSDEVWRFFERPLEVAQCMPGVEEAEPLDGEDDSYSVRATQKLGPMSTTFRAKVRITERIAGARIAFTATGKAVRGAVGNFRAQNTVTLTQEGNETCVAVEGEVALAGVLGTVGSAVINKHAAKVTAEFAANLEQALLAAGEPGAGSRFGEATVEQQ